MKRIFEHLRREQSKVPGDKKVSYQNYIKRLLIGFFTIMLALTFVSRAADSVLVPKITVTAARKGELEFNIQGSGTITDNMKQYLEIYEGVHVSKVLAEEGTRVEPGDPLFQYNLEDLEDKLEEARNEVLRAKINYQKVKLSNEVLNSDTAAEAAELSLQRAKLDLASAEQDLQIAKTRVDKQKKESLEAAQKDYEAALDNYDEQEDKKKRTVEKANRVVGEAEEARTALNEDRTKSETVLSEYKTVVEGLTENTEDLVSGVNNNASEVTNYNLNYFISYVNNRFFGILNSLIYNNGGSIEQTKDQKVVIDGQPTTRQKEIDRIIKAEENIFRAYYGDEEYEAHIKKVDEASQNFERKKEDYSCSILFAAESGRTLTMEEKMSYIRMYEDADAELAELTSEDLELKGAITAYGKALLKKDSQETENTYAVLFELIYREDDTKAKDIKAADKTITEAKEALQETTSEWEDVMEEAQERVDTLLAAYQQESEVYNQITNGTYDYADEVRAEERQVESATRAVEDAETNVETVNENEWIEAQKEQKEEELQELDYELYESELDVKNETVEALEMLLDLGGIVTSPVAGYVVVLGVEVGRITIGSETVAIAVNDCSFQAFLTEEQAERIELGDEISIRIGNRAEEVVVPLTGIGSMDEEGKIEITGVMPEGKYPIGTVGTFRLTKKSKQYHQTIPINALHFDGNGSYYVLVPEEKNTVLGNELVARRIAITLIDKDYTKAAIEGAVSAVDIISGSNKNIEEGDRVRITEEE